MSDQLYCDVDGCDDPQNPGFPRPSFRNGKCSSHMKQLQRTGETKAIAEKLPLREQLIDAYAAHAEAESDADYERTWRHFTTLAKRMFGSAEKGDGRKKVGEAIREALRRRRAEGKRVGRPPKVDLAKLIRLLETGSTTKQLAVALEVSERTIWRALTKKEVLAVRPSSPRSRRAS